MLILVHFLYCIMSHILTMALTTTPLVTVVSSGLSSVSSVTVALGGFACCGGLYRTPFCVRTLPLHHPVWGCLPFIGTPHTQLLASLCIGMFWGYQYVMWAFSLLLKGLGVFPHQLGVWGHQHLRCPYAHSCTFL